ncbi:MAG: transporter substrate-binding domain-containing protein, partial [Anaerovoracaceae bacterium]
MHTKNRAFFSLLLLFLFVLYALAPLQGFAIEEPKEQKTIRVAFPYQAGISYTDEKGNPRGYTYDYLEKIAQFTGWKFEYETFEGMTSNEALLLAMEKVQSGELDLLGCMAKNHPPFEEIFTYSAKSYGVIYSTLAVKDSNLEVNESNYMNIDGLRLGLTTKASSRNENAQKFLTEQGVNFEPVYADSFAGLVALLNAGEVDVIPDVTINGIQGTRHIGQFSPTPFYFASGKGNTQLMASLDDAIKQLNMADPYFQYDLTQKYFGDNMDDFFITPQEKAYLKEKDTLKVLYIPDCAPFIVEDNHGKLTGISVLLMDNFAKAAGLTVEYVRYDSSKDFSKEFSQGGYDCIIGLPINASYNAKLGIVTSNPYMTSSTLSFSRPNQVSSVAEAESVALLRGSELAQLFPDKEILY